MLNVNENLNNLASSWYCLSELTRNSLTTKEAEETNLKLHDIEDQLIPILQQMNVSEGNPYETYLEGDTFVDIWLNEKNHIECNGHYCRPAQQ
jgi:hypothetical protein